MIATLKQVAELAGVSRSAVSRTFTQGASVSEKTRLKVQAAELVRQLSQFTVEGGHEVPRLS